MGRTRIEVDDDLVGRAMALTGARTEREAVEIALRRLVTKSDLYRAILRTKGTLRWEGNITASRSAQSGRR